MSCILLVTKAFDIQPSARNLYNFLNTMYLTDDGSDIGTKNIVLDGTNGDATFAGTITGATICFPNDPSTPCRSTWPSDVWST